MARAIRIHANGGPEALTLDDVPPPEPGAGQTLVRNGAAGVNFIDIHQRAGRYPLPALPVTLGMEGAGRVEAVGPGVTEVQAGDRVSYVMGGHGAVPGTYADFALVPAEALIRLPDEIDDATAAAMTLKGLTAHYLVHDAYSVRAGQTILVHAAAGGVGLILTQMAKRLGARVIGTVGSEPKADLARAHGCDHVIDYGREDVAARVRALTGGEGVPVVFDAVGKDTFEASLQSLMVRGTLVSYGTASGPVPPFNIFELNPRGSLYVTSAGLAWYTRSRTELLARAADLVGQVATGALRIPIRQQWPLEEAA
ncbi:MAG: quinone oxidoreductase, partial [Alphaproteobacteria bacterium]